MRVNNLPIDLVKYWQNMTGSNEQLHFQLNEQSRPLAVQSFTSLSIPQSSFT